MSGPMVGGRAARIRIKGKWKSVLRFFFIAIGYMMTWVLITSELHYYSKWFGPQILLQLNFAFYIPSIPVLLISGKLEKFLDSRFGPIESMAIRLNFGLAANLAICASFPFTTRTQEHLLWTVVVLGTVSAVAFSTSYQLVQWFRHADIIALGIGSVGSGPLVLLIQLGLVQVKDWPQRWQWIAMFEISAAIILVGFASSISLFAQYWQIMTEAAAAADPNGPARVAAAAGATDGDLSEQLLGSVEEDRSMQCEAGLSPTRSGAAPADARSYYYTEGAFSPQDIDEERAMDLAMSLTTNNIIIAPDVGMPFLLCSPGEYQEIVGSWDDSTAPTLRSRRSTAVDHVGSRMGTIKRASSLRHDPASGGGTLGRISSLRQDRASGGGGGGGFGTHRLATSPIRERASDGSVIPFGRISSLRRGLRPGQRVQVQYVHDADDNDGVVLTSPKAHPPLSPFSAHHVQSDSAAPEEDNDLPNSTSATSHLAATPGQPEQRPAGAAAERQHGDADTKEDDAGEWKEMTLAQETAATMATIWPVLVSFLMSVSVLYTVFPFFTYIPSSGLFGEQLARVLFFTRIGADTVGRFTPRMKSLVTKSPAVLLSMALSMVTVAVLLIFYIKGSQHSDVLTLGIISYLWLSAGYINTCANILAPAMVQDALCCRASALMALTFQIAHFAGLISAAILVFVLFGDFAD